MNSGLNVFRSHFGFASFYKSPFNLNVNSPRSVREYHMPVFFVVFYSDNWLVYKNKNLQQNCP